MVYLELVEDDGATVVYDYMLGSKDTKRGTVSVNRKTREKKLLRKSPDGGSLSMHHICAWKRIEEMLDSGTVKQEAFSVWY